MGIKVEKETDRDLYNNILKEVWAIIKTSLEPEFSVKKLKKDAPATSKKVPKKNQRRQKKGMGFCIRCGTERLSRLMVLLETLPMNSVHPARIVAV